jgi:hypothetical protein
MNAPDSATAPLTPHERAGQLVTELAIRFGIHLPVRAREWFVRAVADTIEYYCQQVRESK